MLGADLEELRIGLPEIFELGRVVLDRVDEIWASEQAFELAELPLPVLGA
jgi:hypothetical protein